MKNVIRKNDLTHLNKHNDDDGNAQITDGEKLEFNVSQLILENEESGFIHGERNEFDSELEN